MRKWIGIPFLLIQVFMIVYARFSEARYFCWAPHDSQAEYYINVTINDQTLSDKEVAARYRILNPGRDPRAIEHIKGVVRQYEQTYGQNEQAEVVMMYRINGIEKKPWRWPPN